MQNRLSKAQLSAVRQRLPDTVSNEAIHSRTLVIDKTGELLFLSADGKQLVKCKSPKLPLSPVTQDVQSYRQAFKDAGYRILFVSVQTKAHSGKVSSKFRCQLFLGNSKTPLYEDCEPEPTDGIKYSLDGLQLVMLQSIYDWLCKS